MSDTTLAVNAVNWNIEQSGTLGLNFVLNVLNACMSDEVQPLAVAVCEGLGTRVWLCLETKLIVQEHARRKHRYTPWGRIGLSVGVSPNDIADTLSQSAAGEQFLGLATALLSMQSHFEAAKVLDYLLRDHIQKGFMPEKAMLTLKALQNLMAALDDRMCASGFADNLVGWDLLLRSPESDLRSIFVQPEGSANNTAEPNMKTHKVPSTSAPTPEVLCKVVDALAAIYRIGEATFCRMRVPGGLAAWIITYIRWTTGVTPSIRRYGDACEDSILMHPHSKVLVEVCDFDASSFDIETFKDVSDLGSILEQHSVSAREVMPWFGVVKVQNYLGKRLKDLQDSYTVDHVRNALLMLNDGFSERFRFGGSHYQGFTASPFGTKDHVMSVMQRALGFNEIGTLLDTLREYRLQRFRPVRDEWHIKDSYLAREISKLFFEILILSTFDEVLEEKGLEFHIKKTSRSYTGIGYILSMMADFLKDPYEFENLQPSMIANMRIYPELSPQSLNACALELVTGLSDPEASSPNCALNALVRSSNGYVVYPKVLETLSFDFNLPIRFQVLPGKLNYAGSHYSLITCADFNRFPDRSPSEGIATRSPNPATSSPNWALSEHSDHLSMYWIPYANGEAALNPIHMLKARARLISLTKCHDNCINHSQSGYNEHNIDNTLSVYCKTLGEALGDFDSITQPIRIIDFCEEPQDYLYTQGAISCLGETKQKTKGPPYPAEFITVLRAKGCLRCAIDTASKQLEVMKNSKAKTKYAEQKLFAIIIN